MRKPVCRGALCAIALITAAAALLRLLHLGRVSPDPFYDAAVRSMGLSWHNFLLGAFEPSASVSIDKPPVDLWLQVASVKVLGFSSTTLKLPEALAGIASVPLLYACVRRVWGIPAGLAAAIALAVLPVEMITSRSDTMDGVMMVLIILALFLLLRAAETGRTGWLLGAAAALGLAFDVKLLESIVALPALVFVAFLGLPGTPRRRLAQLAAGAAVYVVVALAWLLATLLVPAHERPYAIGSTNGSAWNAAFVFNGTERLGGKSPEPQFTVYEPGHRYPVATQSERDHIPIVPPSATRLLARIGPLSGQRLGLELLLALLLGGPALVLSLRTGRVADTEAEGAMEAEPGPAAGPARTPPTSPGAQADTAEIPAVASSEAQLRVRRAMSAGLALWLLAGIVLFSHMERLHPRYVEVMVPAVAAVLGVGAAWAATPRGRARAIVLAVALAALVVYGERLQYGTPPEWWVALLAALGALACAAVARAQPRAMRRPQASAPVEARTTGPHALLAPGAVLALTLVAVLAIPVRVDITAIHDHVTDAGYVGALPGPELQALSSFLRAHEGSARYEVAAESATGIGALIVRDARPVLVLTSYGSRVFTTVARLQQLIAGGEVRYAFLNSMCGHHGRALNPACTAPVRWVRAHGRDVSGQAGLRKGLLWLLPGARA